jgi:FG-GAP-like repeat/Cysteine-rich secretory protein family
MANPTAREQELLELINRMRINPAAELPLLLNSTDPQVINNLAGWGVDRNLLATQWSTLTAASPLAWSSQLNDAAVTHNQKMIQYDQQSHQVGVYDSLGNLTTAYEPNTSGRALAANYGSSYVGENIFAYAESTLAAEQAWAIDWGGTAATGGIQTGTGHRKNIMLSSYREVGLGITEETNPSTGVGPLVVTGDFGTRDALFGKGWLLGVAFQDTNKDGWYEAGEGLSDVQVKITGINGTTFSDTLTVGTAGGYQDLLNPGQYQIDFSRNGVIVSSKTTLISATTPANVKIDLIVPLTPTRNDFGGDAKSDILWRNTNGDVALWQMNGSNLTTGSVFANVATTWQIAGTGDFNGDRKSDILWRNTTDGSVALWQMNGATPTTQSVIGSAPTNWQISGTGDFNRDGKADILWRNTTDGSVAIWQMNGNTPTAQTVVGAASTDWKIVGTDDFNGDNKADILWRKADGSVAMWQMNGTATISKTVFANVSTDWQIAGTGDFNGDSKADILWRNNDGQVAIWTMNGTTALSKDLATPYPSVDNSWKISGTSDFNGDGKADILWRNDNGSVETWLMNGSTVTAANLVSPNPVVDNTWKIAAPIL